jgi:hypothetical protein
MLIALQRAEAAALMVLEVENPKTRWIFDYRIA